MSARLQSRFFFARRFSLSGLASKLVTLESVWRQRQSLKSLEPRMLEDIGVSPAEAADEAKRSAWDVPSYWR